MKHAAKRADILIIRSFYEFCAKKLHKMTFTNPIPIYTCCPHKLRLLQNEDDSPYTSRNPSVRAVVRAYYTDRAGATILSSNVIPDDVTQYGCVWCMDIMPTQYLKGLQLFAYK